MRKKRPSGRLLLTALLLSLVVRAYSADEPKNLGLTALEPGSAVTSPGARLTVYGHGFSTETIVYVGGLQVRDTKFLSPSRLEIVTPYLRPGTYQLQVKSEGISVRSGVEFTASAAQIDREIDRALALAEHRQIEASIAILTGIAKTNTDYQVRAFAHYQMGQIYLKEGDLRRWGWTLTFLDSDKAGPAVWTSWRYRLDEAESTYLLNSSTTPDYELKEANWAVEFDVTESAEPRFFRGLVNARYGNLERARTDSDFILKLEPGSPSYRALAAYVAVLSGDKSLLRSLDGQSFTDVRALSLLGQAAYLTGDLTGAEIWWTEEAKTYPLGASLAYWAGKKHLIHGQHRVAEALLAECAAIAPDSKEGREAKALLTESKKPTS